MVEHAVLVDFILIPVTNIIIIPFNRILNFNVPYYWNITDYCFL